MGVPPCPVGVTMWVLVPVSLQKMAEVVMTLCMVQRVVGRGPYVLGVALMFWAWPFGWGRGPGCGKLSRWCFPRMYDSLTFGIKARLKRLKVLTNDENQF